MRNGFGKETGFLYRDIRGCIKSFRTGHLERELQMVQLSATRCICIAIFWVSLASFAAITLCVASQRVFIVVSVYFIMSQSGNFWIHPRTRWIGIFLTTRISGFISDGNFQPYKCQNCPFWRWSHWHSYTVKKRWAANGRIPEVKVHHFLMKVSTDWIQENRRRTARSGTLSQVNSRMNWWKRRSKTNKQKDK
jgi:hypothetical protein